MVIICKDTEPLHEERRLLMIKLDKEANYSEDEVKRKIEMQQDETRLGEIELEIKKITTHYIENAINNIREQNIEEFKELTMPELRKMLLKKHKEYKELALSSRELYQQLIDKKKEGVEIYKTLNTMDFEKLKEEVLKY